MHNTSDLSFKVVATLAAYRGVFLNGTANTVGYPTTTASAPIGITTDTVLNASMAIPVRSAGIAELEFNDSCTSGALVALNSAGQGVPAVGATLTNTYVIGRLIDDKVNTTGTVAKVLLNPHSVYGQL